MVNLPCRELLLQLQQGVALGKGRSAPNASPSRDRPRQCARDQSLDPLSPRPKGSGKVGTANFRTPSVFVLTHCQGLPDSLSLMKACQRFCPLTAIPQYANRSYSRG